MDKQMTLTNLDYLSGDYKVANLGVTYYTVDVASLTSGVLDLDKAIQNFNATLGIDTNITRIQVESYLSAALSYHAAIVTFKKLYDRRNFSVHGVKEFKDMQYIRPASVFVDELTNYSRPFQFEDIQTNVVNMSNARWTNEYLKHYNKIKLPFSLYAVVNQLLGALYVSKSQNGNSFFELMPLGFTTRYQDAQVLNDLADALTTRYEVNPFFDSFLEFVGFSNIQTEELLLESSGISPAIAEDPDLEWALENTVFNRRNTSNNMFVRFRTPDALLEGLPSILNLPFNEVSTIITLDTMNVRWGGQAVMEDRVWKNKTNINTTGAPLGFGGIIGLDGWTKLMGYTGYAERAMAAEELGNLMDYQAVDTFDMYRPVTYVQTMPDDTTVLQFNAEKQSRAEKLKSYGGGAVYRLNFDSNVVTLLKNILLFGEDNFPTVYVPFNRINDVGSNE